VSLINKVLHDLDRRSAFVAPGGGLPLQQVRPLVRRSSLDVAFRLAYALLIAAGIARIAWGVHELRPQKPLVTELAYRADAEAASHVAWEAQAPPPVPEPIEPEAAPASIPEEGVPVELFKLALAIETPIAERPAARPAVPRKRTAPEAAIAAIPKLELGGPGAPSRVERRDRIATPAERNEAQFDSAMALVNQGRISEAENALGALLSASPLHERARQALASLLIEQRRLDDAVLVLRQGIALDPAQASFAVALGRILAERRDYGGALDVLARVQPAGRSTDFNNLLGAVLQRLSKHREAANAYRAALESAPRNAAALMGLAISLESLQDRAEALEAYQRALASGTLTPELRAYAEQKVKELR